MDDNMWPEYKPRGRPKKPKPEPKPKQAPKPKPEPNAEPKKRTRKQWSEEQRHNFRETMARKNGMDAEEEQEALDKYWHLRSDPRYTKYTSARNEKLLAENPGKTKEELGISPAWLSASEVEERHNAQYLKRARVALNLPPIDTTKPEQVEKRINEYLDFCEVNDFRPNLVGMANWLGVTRYVLNDWRNGKYGKKITPIITRAMSLVEEYMVDQMQETKGNPANWIFLLKNMFNYRDQTDLVMTPPPQDEKEMSKDDIEEWFEKTHGTIETTFVEEHPNEPN